MSRVGIQFFTESRFETGIDLDDVFQIMYFQIFDFGCHKRAGGNYDTS